MIKLKLGVKTQMALTKQIIKGLHLSEAIIIDILCVICKNLNYAGAGMNGNLIDSSTRNSNL